MAQGDYEKLIKDGSKTTRVLKMLYGAGDALEPFYYRILYGLRNNRYYNTILKINDTYNVSPNTQQFGFATSNLRQEITSASGLLGQIGQIVKSLVAMKKDHQRIKECLDYFKDKGRPNELVLKGIWADFVDSKTGPSSLTQAAQKLEFFVARDWFFRINSAKDALESKDITNENVRNFLARKYNEYDKWKEHWKPRLDDMDKIIEQQIKTTQNSIKLYREWAQPLLRNVEALKMSPNPTNPDLLKISGTIYSQVSIVAWGRREPKEANLIFDYVPGDKSKPLGERGKCLFKGKDVPFMPVIEITITLRSGPQGYMETLAHYFSKVYSKKEFERLYYEVWNKDPVDDWIKNLMLNEGLNLTDESLKEAVKEKPTILEALADKLIPKFDFSKTMAKVGLNKKKTGPKPLPEHVLDELVEGAGGQVFKDVAYVYFVVKKSFGMLAELAMIR
ncbi:MAG: hypothetical protein WC307_04260 [Candidatus Nanoarchaeia archaeon]|jgi:hypothetical protein